MPDAVPPYQSSVSRTKMYYGNDDIIPTTSPLVALASGHALVLQRLRGQGRGAEFISDMAFKF